MARRLASCPWEWPPMPSATTYRSIGKIRPLCVQVLRNATRLSSFGLDLRTIPVSQPMPTSSTAPSPTRACLDCSSLEVGVFSTSAYSKGSRTASARLETRLALEFPERGRERCQAFAAVFCPRWACWLLVLYHQCPTAASPAHSNTHQRASQVSESATRPSRGNRIAAPRILNR